MSFSTTNFHSCAPTETLYKYLIKAELPRNKFLDELQEKYFAQISQKAHDEGIFSKEERSEEANDWELNGNLFIENIPPGFEEEDDIEILFNQESFVGSVDRLGNGFGNIIYIF